MINISSKVQEVLLKVYVGQNINRAGILQSEIKEKEEIRTLLSDGLIKENHWYLSQFLTTDKGSSLGKTLVMKKIEESQSQLQKMLQDLPQKVLGFIVRRYISKKLVYNTQKPRFSDCWEDRVLVDGRIWILWDKFFASLESAGLCVKTYDYVSTRGGELRDIYYVISPEIQEFLVKRYSVSDFTHDQEDVLKLYPVLTLASRYLTTDNIDFARQQCYELLKRYSITEGQIAGIINDMNKNGITSEYRGLLSEKKPFNVIDLSRFQIYLDKNLIEPAVGILLGTETKIKEFIIEERMPSLSEVKSELGILDLKELGDFYFLVSSFERELREFIKNKLGKGWIKRIENDIPDIIKNWEEKKKRDERWGIEPEQDLINYADIGDYIQIIKKFKGMFSDNDEDLGDIITHLKIWYNQGRNPIMHSRTVNKQKYFTTKSAIEFLKQWTSRKS
jgi:hypothetical protein